MNVSFEIVKLTLTEGKWIESVYKTGLKPTKAMKETEALNDNATEGVAYLPRKTKS